MKKNRMKRLLAACVLPLLGWATMRGQEETLKTEVLAADPTALRKLGGHLIVGYTDFEEVKALVSRGAIGGVFVTRRNLSRKSYAQLKAELAELQAIQSGLNLPPLWIAADQEGGLVSKLSPPLRALPSLGSLWESRTDSETPDVLRQRVEDYARIQAEDLSGLGVNLNFSPVIDLKTPGPAGVMDFYSRIDQRAISADPEAVTRVALAYAQGLKRGGVMPTLKHFPGLGSVGTDTHFYAGHARRSLQEMTDLDLKPFREILANTEAFLMLGHVLVPELDAEYPASLSRQVVQKFLRREWGFQGVVITDDLAMGPTSGRPGGVGPAAVRALNAGVDLLLLAQDPGLYYPVMAALLGAEGKGELASGFLEISEGRLARSREPYAINSEITRPYPVKTFCDGSDSRSTMSR